MAKTAVNQLQDQIEAIRREAYAQGYAAAMQAIRDFAGKTASGGAAAAAPAAGAAGAPRRGRRPGGAGRAASASSTAAAAPATPPATRRRGRAAAGATAAAAATPATPRGRRASAPRPQRGTNARFVEEVLQTNAPRALRPAEIRTAIQREKGVAVAFTSIRHALGQLEARQAAEQVGDSKTWRFTGDGGEDAATAG